MGARNQGAIMNDWLAMGGYAPYVWGSVLMVAACVTAEQVALRMRRRAARQPTGRARR